jgi:hypothetical protein
MTFANRPGIRAGSTLAASIFFLMMIPCAAAVASDPEWPREFRNDKGKLVLYQPQVTSWDEFTRLEARMALAFAPAGSDSPSLGTVSIAARTDTNREDHLVRIYAIRVTDAKFPTLDEAASERLAGAVLTVLPKETVVELERIVANLERFESQAQEAALNVEPPEIFVSTRPAILVLLDGPPLMSPIEGNELKFAVNTNWDLFALDGIYYLRNEDAWIKSESLGGPWQPAGKLPKKFKKLPKKDPNWTEVRESLPGRKIMAEDVPVVYVSEAPSELILLDSEPSFKIVSGTSLLWVENTDSDLFLSTEPHAFYYLVSGRWFRAESLDGPWSFATPDLPPDFAGIPANHPRARVRSSVPGTPEAQEAILLAQIPQKATVNRSAAKPNVTYSGDPEFESIEGTSLYYAVNTPNDVIRVGEIYYVCFQGVWFASTSPVGPWEVADRIPSEVYTIPPSSPVHHTTHVHVYESTPDYVVVGYTSGYSGLYVSYGCVWHGTGWYYPPYYHWGPYPYPIYYPYPYSYGVSAYYNPHTGTYGRGVYGYGPYGGMGYGARYNPTTGTYGRGAAAWGPYHAGGWAQAYNPRTGARAGTYQRATPYAHWGETVVRRGDDWVHTGHYADSRGTVAGIETSEGGRGVGFSGEERRGFVGTDADNNVYAGRDGNVYRHDGENWSRYEDGGWEEVGEPEAVHPMQGERSSARERPAEPTTRPERANADRPPPDRALDQLERDRMARDRGAARARESRAWRSGAGSRPGQGSFRGRGGFRSRRR